MNLDDKHAGNFLGDYCVYASTMEGTQSRESWDLDTDEIASVISEDLHANRPNRWTGPPSTWRALTREERLLWRSMQQLHNQDLAPHLYDTFALKRAGRSADTARALTIRTVSHVPLLFGRAALTTAIG